MAAEEEETTERFVKREQILLPCVYGERGFGSKFDVQEADKRGKYPLRMGYGCQKLVWIRNLEKPLDGFCFEGHMGGGNVKAFAFHPRSGWGLSGDDKGNGKVWTIRKVEPITKNEVKNGKGINDVCWAPDGKKIGFAGKGTEETGKVTPWDSNNQAGLFTSPGKPFLAIAYRPIRPYNICITGESAITDFWKGPPFKKLMIQDCAHHKYVNDCQYSNDGKYLATCSSDKQIALYFAKTAERLRMWGKKGGHKSSVYGLAWGPESNRIATASADKTIKIWSLPESDENKASGEISCIATIDIGEKDICDMQAYIVWKGDTIYASSQNGDITIINAENDEYTVRETITGHKSTVHALAIIPNTNISISACSDGKVVRTCWDTGATHLYRGVGHGKRGYAKFLYATPDGTALYSGANNDTIVHTDLSGDVLGAESFKTDGAIRFVCGTSGVGNLALVGTSKGHIYTMDGVSVVSDLQVEHQVGRADCVTTSNGVKLYIPAKKTVEVYNVSESGTIEHESSFEYETVASSSSGRRVKCKPEGTHVAVIRDDDVVEIYNAKTGAQEQAGAFQKHTAKCNDVTWFKDGENEHGKMLTVGGDLAIKIYDDVFTSDLIKEEAHAAAYGFRDCVAFSDGDHFLASCGDGSVRKYSLRGH